MSPGFWLHHAALAWRQELDARLRPLELTHTQFNLLASANWLGNRDGPPTQQAAADMAGADRMMASKVIATLEGRGLLARRTDPGDARIRRLAVTPAGKALVHQAVQVVAAVDDAFFGADPDQVRLREQFQAVAQRRFRTGVS